MARYTDSVCRLCRREGTKLFLKAERCYTAKCAFERRAYPPGDHGQRRIKITEYGTQLREKQKVRRIYGVLERQFRKYFKEADRRKGITGENLLQILEARLDSVVCRLGFAMSRAEARQMVRHGHISVDGRKVNIPSFLVRPGNVIAIREKSKSMLRVKEIAETVERQGVAEWLQVDREKFTGTVLRMPARDEIDIPVQEHLITEWYSR